MKAPVPMHIPDGFLSVPLSVVLWIISGIFIVLALKRVEKELDDRRLPFIAVLAAAIFAGQMLNFSVTGGTSGHLLGAAIAVILLGPWTAVLVMTCVVSIQALVFQDGGLIVLGANLFNMAILGVAVAYFVYDVVLKIGGRSSLAKSIGAFLSGWFSIFIASLSAALQLAISGTSPANVSIPAMGGIHALIGVGEGLITTAAVSLVIAARPELFAEKGKKELNTRGIWVAGLILTLLLLVLSPYASSRPDGLEWVAEELGFLQKAQGPFYEIIPDYVLPGIQNEAIATIAAGVIGATIVGGVAFIVLRRRAKQKEV